nr:hypothetical protein [Tanacetum cinerariifolium]
MSTRSSARNLFSPLVNPELTIQRRSRSDPTLLNNSEMAAEGPDDLPVPDLRTMEELCQPSLNGRGGPIASIAIQATDFRLKNDMIQQVQNSYQFHGLPGDNANKHLDKFLHVTQSIKVNGVTDDALRLYLFPRSLTHLPPLAQQSESSSSITSSSDTEIAALKAKMAEINKNLMSVLQVNQQVKAVTPNCETCGGPHSFSNCPAIIGNTQNVYATGAYQVATTNEFTNFMKANDAILKNMQTNKTSLTNSNLELKNMFGQFIKMNTASSSGSGTLPGPTIPATSSSSPIVERETEATKDMVHPTNNGSTKDVQPSIVPTESLILTSEPVISPIIKPVASPVSAPRPNQRPSIPYPSRLQDQKLRNKANDQREKFFQIFKDLNFNISFADTLILMPKMAECLALADLGASINLMPLSMWNKLSLPDLSPTCMTLELADHSISHPVGVVEDVFVKVGTFHFSADFVVVDFDADPRVPLILGRSFLKTGRDLIDVFEANGAWVLVGEMDGGHGERVDSGEVVKSGGEGSYRFGGNLGEMNSGFKSCMTGVIVWYFYTVGPWALEDDPPSPKINQSYLDFEGDILLLEAFLNDDPSLPPPNQGNYLPEVRKELKVCKAKSDKSSIDEPPEVELKDLSLHLKYAFLEGNDKLPVIIVKDLSIEEKTALITILKSHKRAIAWKLSDIKGIDPEFCTHKILMEEDFEPVVQHHEE